MPPAPALVDRFRRDLDRLIAGDSRLGLAVSGGPDSLAMLLLAAAARPGMVEAATVDHALRPESRAEAELVASVCDDHSVPHRILTAEWLETPETAVQARARAERYRLLDLWAGERGLDALLTAHHLDDQAETFVMRLARGAGVRGLAGMRPLSKSPWGELPLVRPLLGWRRHELEQICTEAGLTPVIDPSNSDEKFERVRIRGELTAADWLDPAAIASSAAHLAAADEALDWAVERVWQEAVTVGDAAIDYRPVGTPDDIRRRVVARIVDRLASEGDGSELRGAELSHLVGELEAGLQATLRGVLCRGGPEWRFVPAPHRTRRGDDSR